MTRAGVIAALTLAACGGDPGPSPPAVTALDAGARASSEPAPPTLARAPDAEATTHGIDAWDAVIGRDRLLARRGDRGEVRGRLGPVIDRYRWLIDESRGDGTLAIRVLVPPEAAALAVGERVALTGAWEVDAERRWYWAGERAVAFDGAVPHQPTHPPGLLPSAPPARAGQESAGPLAPPPASTLAREGEIAFVVLSAPVKAGDGWAIADEPGGPQVGWLQLPGEDDIYGGQDLRAADEHWSLRPGGRFAVTARRRVRPLRPDDLAELYARGAPWAMP